MNTNIVIVDYSMGNLHSVAKKVRRVGGNVSISSSAEDILNADKLILPGVGHFAKAMWKLKEKSLIEPLNKAVIEEKKPILGICLGMQIMTLFSEEGNSDGLGWIDATVQRFKVNDTLKHKVPHTGWNSITVRKESPIMQNVENNSELYFVHAYHVVCNKPDDILNETEYAYKFASAFQKDNIIGMQYHPEKSHDIGHILIKNFIEL